MKAILRSLRISPKKVNLVAKLVRGKPVDWAINFLKFTPKHSARPLMQTIMSAVANAEENFKQKRKDLFVETIIVNEGVTLKRFKCASRGRSQPILKRTTHISVAVAVRPGMSTASKMNEQEMAQDAKKAAKESASAEAPKPVKKAPARRKKAEPAA